MVHFRVGETDGVSLEMDKWRAVLEKMGHSVFMWSGSANQHTNWVIPALNYQAEYNIRLVENCYNSLVDYPNEQELEHSIREYAVEVEGAFLKAISFQKIDLIIPNNIFSLGWNLPVAVGLASAIEKSNVLCVCHHHDFYWERKKYAHPTANLVYDYLRQLFPPDGDNFSHVVINKLAQEVLKNRRNISSSVVPNVFDFEQAQWKIDPYNSDLKAQLSIPEDAYIVLQATRIVERKGIELAIEFVYELNQQLADYESREKNRAVLIFAGQNEEADYYNRLMDFAKKKCVEVIDISSRVAHSRSQKNGKKIYSLWDVYPHADLVTYPSLLEGWGNQFIEAVFAKKPIIAYEYPVYKSDIAPLGFQTISLGGQHTRNSTGFAEIPINVIQKAAHDAIDLLKSHKAIKDVVHHNFEIAIEHLSYSSLEQHLKTLIDE